MRRPFRGGDVCLSQHDGRVCRSWRRIRWKGKNVFKPRKRPTRRNIILTINLRISLEFLVNALEPKIAKVTLFVDLNDTYYSPRPLSLNTTK
jgi:hypothetical protein